MSRARTGAAGRKRERGQILVLFTLGLVVFLGVSALAIDFGVWLSFHRFYQNVTDAATLAGAPFLTRPLSAPCGSATKDFCARREAWRYLNDSLDLGLGSATLDGYAATNTTQDAPVLTAPQGSSEPYAIWVDTPPGAAGSAYRGIYPDDKRKIWARVDRVEGAFFSRVFCAVSSSCITDRTVTGWATAGAFPNAWAVITLRRPGQAPGDLANDITIAGSNSRLEVVGGDIGGNWNMKLNSDAQLWVRGETDNEADTYLTEWQSCGSACWNAGQVSSGPNGSPAYVTNEPDPLPGFIQDPSYALPAGVDPNGGATTLVPKGTIGNGQIDVDNGAPGGTMVHGIQPLTCDPASPRIGPGYYTSITVRSGKCLILDPITDWTDWTSNGGGKGKGKGKGGGGGGQLPSAVSQNQQPGIFYIDGPVDVNQNAMIVGDGVTLVLRPAPTSDTQNQLTISAGGIVSLNNGETPAPPAPNQQWVPDCLVSDCRLGAWMTNGSSPYLWSNPRHSWAYQGSLTTDNGNIGIALYVIKREQYKIALPDDSSRVVKVTAGAAFTWQGVTYAPHDNVTLAGQPGHDGFGQLVSWTLRFVGGSPVRQTFAGPESSTPRLFEPTIP
jgi:Putative Flp pilus-assembly TadE/G-like